MKYVIYGMGLFGTMIGFVFLFLAIGSKAMKQEELNLAMSQAMKSAFVHSMKYEQTKEECISDFLQALSVSLEGKGDLAVEIYEVDLDKGVFRAKARLDYRYINDVASAVTVDKTILYDPWIGREEGVVE